MRLLRSLAKAARRLRRRPPLDDPRLAASEKFFDERARAFGPDAYDHVDVERDFRKPQR